MKVKNLLLKTTNKSLYSFDKNPLSMLKIQFMCFGGSHSHGHGHEHHEKKDRIQEYLKEPFHKNYYAYNHSHHHHDHHHEQQITRFDPVKFLEKINSQQRKERDEKVQFVDDDLTPQTADFVERTTTDYYNPTSADDDNSLLPYETLVEKSNASLLDESDIRARIYNILRQFDFIDLDKVDFSADYEKELGLDSLDWNALLTSIEYEFNTLFNDTFYEHWRCLNDVVKALKDDELVF